MMEKNPFFRSGHVHMVSTSMYGKSTHSAERFPALDSTLKSGKVVQKQIFLGPQWPKSTVF